MLKPLHGFHDLLGDTFGRFVIEDCDVAVRAGRDWHLRAHGYCFPFDERREFVWHATEAEAEELGALSLGGIKAFKHDPAPVDLSFNDIVTQRPDLLWSAMGIPVFNR